jgi:hypothetical protein
VPITVQPAPVREVPPTIVVHPSTVAIENHNHVDAKPVESDKDVTYKKDADGNVTGYVVKKAGE